MKIFTTPLFALLLLGSMHTCRGQQPRDLTLTGDYWGTHDPSMIKAGATWYVFATGKARDGGQFQMRCSADLHAWTLCGHVFDQIPEWVRETSPKTEELWAPDISYEDGEYRLYYAYSVFGKNTSGIGLATNRTLDRTSREYKWTDHGLVLRSTITDNFNAIDPNFILDAKGRAWLAFGSFWSGIKMRRLDEKTGMLSKNDTKLYALASRAKPVDAVPAPHNLPPNWEAIEAPFLVHHGDYYYLFVSWDLCCRGTKSTYRTMVGRSAEVTGPYLDKASKPMLDGGGSELLTGSKNWVGPGGESIAKDPRDGDLLVFHAYDAQTGKPAMHISPLKWTSGWPEAALSQ